MLGITPQNVQVFNQNLRYESPEEIIAFALELSSKTVLTTSFGKHSEVLIHAASTVAPAITVLWVDTGLNTQQTYAHAQHLEHKYNLNLRVASPEKTTAYLQHRYGNPHVNNPNHDTLSQILKLDPLKKVFKTLKPEVWFTNIRKEQTNFREGLDILSFSPEGILKVSPFFYYSNAQIVAYARQHMLNIDLEYYDPIKALDKRECGIHFSN